jgi:iduronate 2-sulfatase
MASAGRKVEGIVEFVGIYPTLVEVCGLPAPKGTEGTSFRQLLADPNAPGKECEYSWYPKGGFMGRALRNDRYRYVEWTDPKTGKLKDVELYDHQYDPQENQNVSGKEENKAVMEKLHELLMKAPGDAHDHG